MVKLKTLLKLIHYNFSLLLQLNHVKYEKSAIQKNLINFHINKIGIIELLYN